MNEYIFNSQSPLIKRKKRSGKWKIGGIILVMVLTAGFLIRNNHTFLKSLMEKTNLKIPSYGKTKLVNPEASIKPFNIATGGISASTEAALSPLGKAVQEQLVGTTGSYGVYIYNFKTGESYTSNPHLVFETGSLYKLWVMAEVYKQINEGKFTGNDTLSDEVGHLNSEYNIDPDTADLTDGTITLSVNDALNQMITISHNYAALLLTDKIGLSSVAEFLQQNGFKESKVGVDGGAPTTTASDMGLFFKKLYAGQLGTQSDTKTMITLLKNQQLNNKLPKYLPSGVEIAHKTGELDDYSHDAGIIYTPEGNYIIVVLTETTLPQAAEDRIAKISQAVYDYFMKGGE